MEEIRKRRIAEAMECMKKADEHLKISMLKMKFKRDYDSAAMEYDRAAVCFKNATELERSRDAYLKAAEMHKNNGNLFHWAKSNESAAMICKEMGDGSGIMKYMNLAAEGYAESGSFETAIMTLNKAAKCLEDIDAEEALDVYFKAMAMMQSTDRSHMTAEFTTRIPILLLKLKRYEEAANIIFKEVEDCIKAKETDRVGQLTTALVLVHLARGDSVAAAKSVQNSFRCDGFEISEYAIVCNALISAYESGDNSCFQQVLQRPLLKNMDNEYLRLMKTLKAGSELVGKDAGEGEGDEDEDLK